MREQEQIEEMANYYCEYCKKQTGEKFCEHIDDKSCNIFFEAELFYNAGYRKIPENAVVLTDIDLADRTYEIRKRAQEETRKETAKEFAEKLKQKYAQSCSEYYPELITLTSEQLDELLKEYEE